MASAEAFDLRSLIADDPEQSRLFIRKAREIGADEEKSEADEVTERPARKPPQKRGNRGDE
jgi:hypothetical protein